MKNSEIWLYLI